MTNNEQIQKLKEYYRKNNKSPFLFNINTGEILPEKSFEPHVMRINVDGKMVPVNLRCGGDWRYITDEYYPVFAGEKYVSWCPYGFEDKEFFEELNRYGGL